jgi:carotenoid cleavage dioxygenase-like enzyme
MAECFQWDQRAEHAPVLVFEHSGPNAGRLVASATIDALFSLHHTNAFETDQGVILDVVAFADSSILSSSAFELSTLRHKDLRDSYKGKVPQEYMHRIEVVFDRRADPFRATASSSKIDSLDREGLEYNFDFPMVNPKFQGKKYCFVYGLCGDFCGNSSAYSSSTWVKQNMCDLGEPVIHLDATDDVQWPTGDAAFVPSPHEGALEDEGVLIMNYIDGSAEGQGRSYLRVVDTRTLREVATIKTVTEQNWHMPYGFHGIWLPEEEQA